MAAGVVAHLGTVLLTQSDSHHLHKAALVRATELCVSLDAVNQDDTVCFRSMLIYVDILTFCRLTYTAGLFICAIGVALLFHTYFPPEAYELFVKELSQKFHMTISKTKTIYDCCSCALGVVLSLCFFGSFVGIQWGTIVCAVVNGWLIGRISNFLDDTFSFQDAFPFRDQLL